MNKYGPFFKALENQIKELDAERKIIQNDKDLSEQGRQKKRGEADGKYQKESAELAARLNREMAKDVEERQGTLNPPKPHSALDRLKAKIHQSSNSEYVHVDDNDRALALVESNERVISALQKSTFQNIAAGMDQKELSSALDRAFQSGNQGAIENLAEVAAIKGNEGGVKAAQAYMQNLREQNMTPAQKLARVELRRIELHRQLFDYAVKRGFEGKGFHDLRGGETDQGIDMEIAQIKAQMQSGSGSD